VVHQNSELSENTPNIKFGFSIKKIKQNKKLWLSA
jgi:hypothetical protein